MGRIYCICSIYHEGVKLMLRCPACSGHPVRIHRRIRDRLISLYKPIQRYECDDCGWTGNIIIPGKVLEYKARRRYMFMLGSIVALLCILMIAIKLRHA